MGSIFVDGSLGAIKMGPRLHPEAGEFERACGTTPGRPRDLRFPSNESSMCSEEDDFRDWLNELIRELRKLQNALSRSGWALEGLENGAKFQRKKKKKKPRKTARKRRPGAHQPNPLYVEEGVTRVVIQHHADGWMYAQIENVGLPILLRTSQRLHQLLLVLCGGISRVNNSDSGIVPYKTSGELREAIEKISGKQISVSYLQNLIRQLRRLLEAAQVNPKLIQTGGGGYRLRLQLDGRVHDEQR